MRRTLLSILLLAACGPSEPHANLPPSLRVTRFLPQVDSGGAGAIAVRITDPDSPTWTASIVQRAGPPLADLSVTASEIRFVSPPVGEVTTVSVSVTLDDGEGGVSETELTIGLRPVSGGGRVKTVQGSPTGPGVHAMIVGDGYTAEEAERFYDAVDEAMEALLTTNPIAQVNRTWNVHAVEIWSPESGVDVVAAGVYRDTAFDTAIQCTSALQQVCGSPSKLIAALDDAFPAWNLAITILNTS